MLFDRRSHLSPWVQGLLLLAGTSAGCHVHLHYHAPAGEAQAVLEWPADPEPEMIVETE